MNVPVALKKPLKYCFIACLLTAIYSLLGFFLIPTVLKWKLPDIIEQETGRKTQIEKIQFNPFLLAASIHGFQIQELQGQPFTAFDNFDIDINAWQSVKKSTLVLDNIWLNKLFVHIAKQKNGEFNYIDLIKADKKEKSAEKSTLFPLLISKLSVTEGKLVFEDAHSAKPVKEDVIPINLTLENFTTQLGQQSKLGFSIALSSGGSLDWQGELSINPMRSSGHVKLDNIKLQRIYELALQDKMQINLQGTQMLELDYKIDYAENSGLALLISHSKLGIHEFKYSGNGNKLATQIANIVFEGAFKLNALKDNIQFNADNTKIQIQDFQLSGLNPVMYMLF